MNFNAMQIAAATGGEVVTDAGAGPVLTDTRALVPGCWFLAIRGPRFDANDFVGQAADAGAIGAVVSADGASFAGGLVRVADGERALQALGRAARARVTAPVIGLTGSSGKTTTRALIALALRPLGEVHQTVGNLNNHLGVPMTLLACPDRARAVVLEMGTSSPGEIRFLAELGRPNIRLIVNIGPAHLEELGGLDGVAVEKGAMFDTASDGDTCCVNLDDERVAALPLPTGARRVTYGRHGDAALRLIDARIVAERLSTVACFATPEGLFTVEIPAPGMHIAHNAAGALAVAYAAGVPLAQAAAALADYEPVGMRLRAERLPGDVLALNDAYNANPQSMSASLSVLASLPGRRFAVLGDMLELGPDEAQFHAALVAEADMLGLHGVALVGPRMVAAAGQATKTPCWADLDADALGVTLAKHVASGDTLLFKGSRGARVERVLEALRRSLAASGEGA